MQIAPEHCLNTCFHKKKHWHLCLYVELPNHKRIWYRASPKIEYAAKQYNKMHDGENELYQYLNHHYINVPLVNYFARNKGVIGVGKIIRYKYASVPNDLLCTRSQFIDEDRLNHLFLAYHYLRHDYHRYSRLNIFVDLYNWKKQIKDNKKETNLVAS